ncbi:hypothetical protein JCM9279_001086 [Rhodotorula babjevae]
MPPAPPPTNTGHPCAYCHHSDLLPLTCPHCHALLCAAHAPPADHACPADPSLLASLAPLPPQPRAQSDTPTFKSLLPDPDRHARQRAPAPAAHHDTALRATQLAALAKFKSKASASSARSSSSSSAAPTSPAAHPTAAPPQKLPKAPSPAVALMRLKQRALPLDARHAQRPGDVGPGERRFFFSISGGKALDLAADLLKVANRNHLTTDAAQRLSLALAPPSPSRTDPDPPTRIDLAAPLAAQVPDGGTVVLLRGHVWA